MTSIDKETMTKLLRDELKGVTNEMKALNTKFDNLQTTLTQVTQTANQAHEIATMASTDVSVIAKRVSQLESALSSSRVEQKKLEAKTLYLESYSRRVNLKIEGIKENRGEDCMQLACDAIANMNIDTDTLNISRAHRLGPFNAKQSSPRAIIIKFNDFNDRERVWEKRSALKGSGLWIREDYPAAIEAKRKILWPYLRAARLGDPELPQKRITAFLRLDQLVINKRVYSSDNINLLPDFVKHRVDHPPNIIKTDDVTVFFTRESPLSNFYPCHLNIDDRDYSSVEQYLSYKKALLFGSNELAEQLLIIRDPRVLKQRVKRLANFDHAKWETESGDILMTALNAKFSQDDDLRDELLSTGDTAIGEASPHDLLFGIGLSLHNPNAVNASRWRGLNLQGKKLMEVRAILQNN